MRTIRSFYHRLRNFSLYKFSLVEFLLSFFFVGRAHQRKFNVPKINSRDNCNTRECVCMQYGVKETFYCLALVRKWRAFRKGPVLYHINNEQWEAIVGKMLCWCRSTMLAGILSNLSTKNSTVVCERTIHEALVFSTSKFAWAITWCGMELIREWLTRVWKTMDRFHVQ